MAKTKYVTSKENISTLIQEVKSGNDKLEADHVILEDIAKSLQVIVTKFIEPSLQSISHMAVAMAQDMRIVTPDDKKGSGASKEHDEEALKAQEKAMSEQEKIAKIMNDNLTELKLLRKDLGKGGILAMIMGAAGLLAGFVAGFVEKIMQFFRPVVALFEGKFKMFEPIINAVKNGFTKFIELFRGLGRWFSELTVVEKTAAIFQKGWAYFSGLFKEVAMIIGKIGDAVSILFGEGKKAIGFFEGIITYFKGLGGIFEVFFKFGRALGAVFAKLLIPIQVILSIWDTVSGALDGWNKTQGDFMAKFFGALKGGLTGLLNGLIGGLLDLMKDGVSWILEALGFDKAAKILDSFSFSKLIEDVVSGFFDMVEGMVRYVIDLFQKGPAQALQKIGDVMANIADAAKNVLKSLLRSVLPNPAGSMMEKIASKAIPDAVYEFAGINPKTGKSTDAVEPPKAAEVPVVAKDAAKTVESKEASRQVEAPKIETPAPAPAPSGGMTPEMRAQILSQPMRTTLPPAQEENTAVKQEVEMTRGEANVKAMNEGRRPSFDRARPSKESMGGGNTAVISSGTTKWDPEDMMARGVTP
jgi:hypothetical protein